MKAKGTVHKFGDNVDTDVIIPARYLNKSDEAWLASHCMEDIDADFVNKVKPGDIMVAEANFGCGSSREHAPWALEDYGFRTVIAPSFADIFFNNCFNNGILPIKLDNSIMDTLFANTYKYPAYKLVVDLENQKITDAYGLEIPFDVNPFHRHKLLNGLDDIGLTLLKDDKITEYEKAHGII